MDERNDFEKLKSLAEILQSPAGVVEVLDSLAAATAKKDAACEALAKAEAAHAEKLVVIEAAHAKKLQEMSAAERAASEQRSRVLAQREAALVIERRSLDEEKARVAAKELATEHRIADMGERLRAIS